MIIIGIAGGTGSGKTTVVRKLQEYFYPGEVVIIPQDPYYKDSSHVPVEERQNINFDHPNAFDWPLLSKHLEMLKIHPSVQPLPNLNQNTPPPFLPDVYPSAGDHSRRAA